MTRRHWLLLAGFAMVAALLAANSILGPFGSSDAAAIARIRAERLVAYRLGRPMPGAPDFATPLELRLQQSGFKLGAPMFLRTFKREFQLEVWLQRGGRYELFAAYPICYFSGGLGPKVREGDRQSPEGIYRVEARQLNPASRWHRAFNLGYPNAFDRAHGRTGSYLMVHGGCSSIGCYAMTDVAIDEIYRLAVAALGKGQSGIQVHALPFRMTTEALARRSAPQDAAFWADLKSIDDTFEATRQPPDVKVCGDRYRLATATDLSVVGQSTPSQSCQKL